MKVCIAALELYVRVGERTDVLKLIGTFLMDFRCGCTKTLTQVNRYLAQLLSCCRKYIFCIRRFGSSRSSCFILII
jgi:hypothetical protein